MASLKPKFINGGQERGHDPEILEKIWKDWEKFASYAFNKSHATCYSWVAFQTAYLKANYPSEYMAAVLSRSGDLDKMTKFMDECKSMRIAVKGPDINESFRSFSANKTGDIRFGLSGLKGIGTNVVSAIIDERDANGPYKSIFDFVERVNLSACNRRALESLALAGAFDCFSEVSREDFFARNTKDETLSEILVRYGQKYQLDKNSQTISLFGGDEVVTTRPQLLHSEKWPMIVKLEKEKELVGMYLSAHPLDPYYLELAYGCNVRLKDLSESEQALDKELTFGGLVVGYETKISRKGSQFGIMKIEDYSGSYEIRLFGKNFIEYDKYGKPGTPILVRGMYQKRKFNDSVDLNILSMDLLEDYKGKMIHSICIEINVDDLNDRVSELLKDYLGKSTENRANLYYKLVDVDRKHNVTLLSKYKMPVTKQLIECLKENGLEFEVNYM